VSTLVVPLAAIEATDPNRFGPKAASLAVLGRAGLPVADGFCVDALAYRLQVRACGLEDTAREVFAADGPRARRCALDMRLGLMQAPIVNEVREPLLHAWRSLRETSGAPLVVRSTALVEDRAGASFAGQFESFLGLESEKEFLAAVRACWAALWSTRALRYMATHGLDAADTAMALLLQPLVAAKVSGGGLSRTAAGEMLITAARGLGAAIAQGEVVPDRYLLSAEGTPREAQAGPRYRPFGCVHDKRLIVRPLFAPPCLGEARVTELGGYLRKIERVMATPVEIEWSLDDTGVKLLQARPLEVGPAHVPDEVWLKHPRLSGQGAGVGWGTGRARVISCECTLSLVAPGDVLVTTVAGPGLMHVLPRVAGVVAELGGSTSHLASIARERGLPMVLGVLDATTRIPDGATVAVDGVSGQVRWMN
jgi:pyruvate,water dikinase